MKYKKLISFLLAAAMLVAIMAGCSSDTKEEPEIAVSEEQPAPVETPVEEASSEAPEDASEGEGAASAEEFYESAELETSDEITVERVNYELPLYEDPESFTFWCIMQGGGESRMDFLFWNQLNERTNVYVEYVEAGESVALEQYNLMVASGNLCDVIWEGDLIRDQSATSVYPGGYQKAIDDGIYMDLTDVIVNDCPNYYSLLQQYPSVYKDLETDEGILYCFAYILNATSAPNMGPFVRTDVLEATGHEVPTTVDGWYDAWKAMIDGGLIEAAVRPSQAGVMEVPIATAMGTSGGSQFLINKEDNSVFYDPISENFREYMEFFAQCYADGIVHPDFYSMVNNMDVIDKGTIASFSTMAQAIANQMNANYDYTAVPYPHLEGESGPLLETYATNISNFKWCTVSAATEKLDVIAKWMDFLYSDEGIRICNFGFDEGVSYEVLEDGSYKLLDSMSERDEQRHTGIMNYTMKEGPSFFYWDNEYNIMDEKIKNIYSIWLDVSYEDALYSTMPSIGLSDSENETVAVKMTDIETYVETETMLWMTCQKEITDEVWNEFVSTVESLGIAEVVEAYQSAYDRYLER